MLRHTCATRLAECGVDVRVIQEWLGHSNLQTTQRYLRVRPVRLQDAVEKLWYGTDGGEEGEGGRGGYEAQR